MALLLAGGVMLLVAACGGTATPHPTGMPRGATPSRAGISPMPGMDDPMPDGDGLSTTVAGIRLDHLATAVAAGRPGTLRFQITDGGVAVTRFLLDQTKFMHLYVIRTDLTGFQHLHPTMATDGTWTVDLAPMPSGRYRLYTAFTATAPAAPVVLGDTFTVPGTPTAVPLPAPSATAAVDGYTLTLSGAPRAGTSTPLSMTVTRAGRPVANLQPYLDTYAHITAIHHGDLAFAHLHPSGDTATGHGGPTLRFAAMLPEAGQWRLFVQFQTGGNLHTAAITITVT